MAQCAEYMEHERLHCGGLVEVALHLEYKAGLHAVKIGWLFWQDAISLPTATIRTDASRDYFVVVCFEK